MLAKVTKRYVEFNNEGMKDIYFDLIGVLSTFGGHIIGISSRISNTIHDSFGPK